MRIISKPNFIFFFFVLIGVHALAQDKPSIMSNFPADSVIVFKEPGYKLKLQFTDTTENENIPANTLLTLYHYDKIVMKDSLFCKFLRIKLKDFNNDGVKDVLILHYSSARSDISNYLYLVDDRNHNLKRVKGFTKVLNPILNKKTGVIAGTAHYGDKEYCSFYRIKPNGLLVKARRSYERRIE